jgi:hypothetical protein
MFIFDDPSGDVERLGIDWHVSAPADDDLMIPAKRLLQSHRLIVETLRDARQKGRS